MTVDDNDPVLDKPSELLRKILMTCDTQIERVMVNDHDDDFVRLFNNNDELNSML
ncbi:MAG: hypothetical protein M3250_02830 [Thermoproteota archaeon]|nr:hypothetical protein [Thermoproteota archaeon]